jgi:hypothetical protein
MTVARELAVATASVAKTSLGSEALHVQPGGRQVAQSSSTAPIISLSVVGSV